MYVASFIFDDSRIIYPGFNCKSEGAEYRLPPDVELDTGCGQGV